MPTGAQGIMRDFILLMKSLMSTELDSRRIGNFLAHDELDLLPGTAILKIGGGSAGHNGLKSIVSCLGSSDFVRLRIGIGHPRDKQLQIPVADYVLSRPSKEDQELISSAIKKALSCISEIVEGDFSRPMSVLNEKADSRK